METYHLPRLGLHSVACQADKPDMCNSSTMTEILNNCDADTMTDAPNACAASSSQTESLMTSLHYEFEYMSTKEQISLVHKLFDIICCREAIPAPEAFIQNAVTSMKHLHRREKSNVIAALVSTLGAFGEISGR